MNHLENQPCSPQTLAEEDPLGEGIHRCVTCGSKFDICAFDPLALIACRSCGTRLIVAKTIGQYELQSVAGRGGTGIVYKSIDRHLSRPAAVKVIRKDRLSREAMEDLLKEARLTAAINHPHVVRIFTVGNHDGRFYIAMEYVAKGTLDDLMHEKGIIEETQVLTIAIQVAEGLRAASTVGLLHHDVKPRNILLADSHSAKIMDFGLAVLASNPARRDRDAIWGTPYYIAPEKVARRREDVRSDIYSLGATLFHALTGRPPFEDDDPDEMILKRLRGKGVRLESFAPSVTGLTALVVNRMLKRDPEDRFQNYDDLLNALQHARERRLAARKSKGQLIIESEKTQMNWTVFSMILAALFALSACAIGFVLKHPHDWKVESMRNAGQNAKNLAGKALAWCQRTAGRKPSG